MEPIAKRLGRSGATAVKASSAKDDLDDKIKQLEQDIGSSSDSSDEEEVVNLSEYATERTEQLPEHLLPPQQRSDVSSKPRKKRKIDVEGILEQVALPKRVPFACKPCGFVGRDLDDLEAHKATQAHEERVELKQEALHCALCQKSFTSVAQLTEHRAGKWHQQRQEQRRKRHIAKVCFDYTRGVCNRGDRCIYMHTRDAQQSRKKQKKTPCREFARSGSCRYGANCIFAHEEA